VVAGQLEGLELLRRVALLLQTQYKDLPVALALVVLVAVAAVVMAVLV
jgi:hypothetical protein